MFEFDYFRFDPDAWSDFYQEHTQRTFADLARQMDEATEEYLRNLPYDEFLATPYWQVVRSYVIANADNRCQNCSETESLHVHHQTYEHRGSEWRHLEDLVVLCKGCHQEQHRGTT